jgi:hypothetical protein
MGNLKIILAILLCLLTGKRLFCQIDSNSFVKLSGKVEVKDPSQIIKEYIVLLKNGTDSTLVKSTFTDSTGSYELVIKSTNNVFLEIINELEVLYSSSSFDLNFSKTYPIITLKNQQLEEVVIVNKKQFIERSNGKTTLNIENSISSSGSSAFELIEKAPGVAIQNGDNIILNGKQGVIVQIDGKMIPMSGTELANYLRAIGSNNIEKIELITNPSSKYDAAGVSIINVRLKKDMRFGTNGTLNGSIGHGVFAKAGTGITLNHRNKKINLFGNYNYTYRKGYNKLDLEREFYEFGQFTGAYNQKNRLTFPLNDQLLRTGFDYKINSKTSVGFVVNGIYNSSSIEGNNQTDIMDEKNTLKNRFTTQSVSSDNDQSVSSNLNLKHVLDTLGQEITFDLDYALYLKQSLQNFDTRYYDLNGTLISNPYLLNGDIDGNLSIYSVKTDYIKPLKNKAKLEAGLKSSYVTADNNLKFYDKSNNVPVFDSTKSNHFIYTENINSSYVSVNKEYKKWNVTAGIRAENTNITGVQKVTGESFDSTYIQLFPSVSGSYTLNEKHTIDFNFNNRIDRPSYRQLNPFKMYLDPTTYSAGNPYLRPQTTQTAEMGYLFKNKYYINLGFSRTQNNITDIIAPVEGQQKITAQTVINLDRVDMFYSNLTIPVDVTKWWNSSNNLSAYVPMYSGSIAKTVLVNSGVFSFNYTSVNTFKLNKKITAELSINYQSKQLHAFDLIRPIYSLNTGIQAQLLKNKGTLKINFTDLFFTNRMQANVTFTDYKEHFKVRRESSVGTISFTYRFGNSKLQGVRRNMGGAEDLKNRI